jgi:CxxC-x17-CxxC domain-containing protein
LNSAQVSQLLPSNCKLVPFDTLSKSLMDRIPPRLHMLVPSLPGMSLSSNENERVRHNFHTLFGPRKLYEANCSKCSKQFLLPFPPNGREAYCRDCYQIIKRY